MIRLTIDAIAIILELIIYYYFFKHFLGKPRFSRKIMLALYIVTGLLSFCLSYFPIYRFVQIWGYCLIIVLLAMCYEGQIFMKVFMPFLFQVVSMMVERSYTAILLPLKQAVQIYGETGSNIYYFTGVTLSNLTILLLVWILSSCHDYLFLKKIDIELPKYFSILFMFPVCMLFMIDQVVLLVVRTGSIDFITVFPVVLLTLLTVAFFFTFDWMLQSLQNKKHVELLHSQLEQEQNYHAILLSKHQQFQRLRHDMKQNFSNIAGLIKNQQYNEALEYAQQQSGQLASLAVIETGLPLLDTILTTKEEQAKQIGVQIQSYVSADWQDSEIEISDLASLCANVLDNAIEAVMQIKQPESRKIWCNILQENQYLHIVVRNTTAGDVKIVNNDIVTTKEDKTLHGYGLKIIRSVTDKYQGTLSLQYKDNLFALKVLLPMKRGDDI